MLHSTFFLILQEIKEYLLKYFFYDNFFKSFVKTSQGRPRTSLGRRRVFVGMSKDIAGTSQGRRRNDAETSQRRPETSQGFRRDVVAAVVIVVVTLVCEDLA